MYKKQKLRIKYLYKRRIIYVSITCSLSDGIRKLLLLREIQELGYETNVENGRIFFEGDASAIVKANLWLRTADRIKIVIGRFNATTFDELFEQTKALPWESIIDKEGNFRVQGRSVKSTLT